MARKKTQSEGTIISEAEQVSELVTMPASEVIARMVYEKLANEMKDRGDFPNWDYISDRAREAYITATQYVIDGSNPRTRFEEMCAIAINALRSEE